MLAIWIATAVVALQGADLPAHDTAASSAPLSAQIQKPEAASLTLAKKAAAPVVLPAMGAGHPAPPSAAAPLAPHKPGDEAAAASGGSYADPTANLPMNFMLMALMGPLNIKVPLPLLPGNPILPGIGGMAARAVYNPFGPHWHKQVTSRAVGAAETLIDPMQFMPQDQNHPNYPPGIPLRLFGGEKYRQYYNQMRYLGSTASFSGPAY